MTRRPGRKSRPGAELVSVLSVVIGTLVVTRTDRSTDRRGVPR